MSIMSDYTRDIRKGLAHMDVRERDAVLKEIRVHLGEAVAQLQAEDPKLSPDEAAIKATYAFGNPRDIGVAYGGDNGIGVINRTTGDRLLEVAIVTGRVAGTVAVTTGRGIKGVLKWAGISIAAILGITVVLLLGTLVFAGGVIDTFQDDIRENTPRPLYQYSGSWGVTEPHTETRTDSFQIREGVRDFIIEFNIRPDDGGGCTRITLTAEGSTTPAYDSGTGCGETSQTLTLSDKGTWTIQYTYVAYVGSVSVGAYYFEEVPPAAA
jgi:hypothetical protein